MKKPGFHQIMIWVKEEKYRQIKAAAESAEEPVTTWCRRAIFTMLRKWEVPVSKALWTECKLCGKHHDPSEHGLVDAG